MFFVHWNIIFFTLSSTIILVYFTSFPFVCAFIFILEVWDWLRDFECNSLEFFLSSTEPLTSNHADFNWEHEVILKLWQDSIRSCIMRVLKYLLCISSTNGLSIYPGRFQHVKDSYHNPSTRFFSFSVIVIHFHFFM